MHTEGHTQADVRQRHTQPRAFASDVLHSPAEVGLPPRPSGHATLFPKPDWEDPRPAFPHCPRSLCLSPWGPSLPLRTISHRYDSTQRPRPQAHRAWAAIPNSRTQGLAHRESPGCRPAPSGTDCPGSTSPGLCVWSLKESHSYSSWGSPGPTLTRETVWRTP